MINGMDLFREHFADYKDQYTIIGGFACDLLMTDAGLGFRQTVDIDMVIIIEALTTEFAVAFWSFIDAGGYPILDAEHIIPLKMKAWLDLRSKKRQGIHVDSRDLRKHRLDVFRLYPLIRGEQKICAQASVIEDIQDFIMQMREMDMRLSDIGISRTKESILDVYSRLYIVE